MKVEQAEEPSQQKTEEVKTTDEKTATRFNRMFRRGYARLPDQESETESIADGQLSQKPANHLESVPLSNRASGSQELKKETESDNETKGEHDAAQPKPIPEGMVGITVCQVGKPRRMVPIDEKWTIKEFTEQCFPEEYSEKKLIRVIYAGKRLKNEDVLKDAGIKEGVFIHVSITDCVDPEGAQNVRFDGQTDDWDHDQMESDARFARMLERTFNLNGRNTMNLEDRPRNARRDNAEFIWGFVLGSLLGIFMLIWVMQPNVPKTMKFGIVCGICLHIYINYSQFDQ